MVGLVFSSALTFFFKQYAFSRALLLITYLFAGALFILWRFIAKIVFKIGIENSMNNSRTLIVGSEEYCNELATKLNKRISDIYTIVGFIGKTAEGIGKNINGYTIIGSLENIVKVIKEEKISKVIFASHEISFEKMFKIVSQSDNINVEFLVAGTELDYLVGKSSVTMLEDISLVKVDYNISDPTHKISKGIFDIVFGILFMLIYPFVLLLSSFHKKKSDFENFILSVPLVIVRKKSLVGPKEERSRAGLYLGKAGITGLWFLEKGKYVKGEEYNKLDVYYAKNQNIWLDLEILGKTFSKMFFGKDN